MNDTVKTALSEVWMYLKKGDLKNAWLWLRVARTMYGYKET